MNNNNVIFIPDIDNNSNISYSDFKGSLVKDSCFSGEKIEMKFKIGDLTTGYGICFLEDYYKDMLEELLLLKKNTEHRFELSGYPVGDFIPTKSGCFIFRVPGESDQMVDAMDFMKLLKRACAVIENYIHNK